MNGRSTPDCFRDFSVVIDSRGKRWKYSAPADVWRLITGDLGPGSVSPTSARSYQRLEYEFGPLIGGAKELWTIKLVLST